ncbi:acyltransferase [uncultured Mitsuokella sp.]|uniref:acyltransferase n=1 Tax=uncultured Mitsuokella sp. TaxID=453120 RepID=UPI0026DB0830|nr:acyltransferase [uncultured Mitsuokella sp.]
MQEQASTQPVPHKRKPRLAAIEYIRGISMMGVIAIHVGSQYIMNTSANVHLIALFEVASRFSVPIFFFISAFGLFYNLDTTVPFDYRSFLKRRFKTVLVPYLVWSLFYLLHDGILYKVGFPDPLHLLTILFFGNAKYQLYFLVILIWFYLAMPIWIYMVRRAGKISLLLLLAVQIAFDYWSSFSVSFNVFVYGLPDHSVLKPFLMYRLNYWVFHYVFIFVLGGYLAVHIKEFQAFMQKHRTGITLFFWASLAWLLAFYYKLLYVDGYTALEAINTAHQLSPTGIFYTIAASLFFFTIFTYQRYPAWLNPILYQLGHHSYFAYLVHPFFITYAALALQHAGRIMTAPVSLAFYCVILGLSMTAAILCRRLGEKLPLLNEWTIGVYPKKK